MHATQSAVFVAWVPLDPSIEKDVWGHLLVWIPAIQRHDQREPLKNMVYVEAPEIGPSKAKGFTWEPIIAWESLAPVTTVS